MAVLEGLACKTPVVISEACHFPEVAASGAGYLVSLEPADIAKAIVRIANDPARREAMGEAGRRLIQHSFTWQEIARRALDAYARRRRLAPRRTAA